LILAESQPAFVWLFYVFSGNLLVIALRAAWAKHFA
jgi:hypothetical protein